MKINKFIEEKLKSVEELKPLMPEAFSGELALEVAFKEGYNTAITQALSDAIKYGEGQGQVDLLQRQRGVMGKYNCELGRDCVFVKKYFDLAEKELAKLTTSQEEG